VGYIYFDQCDAGFSNNNITTYSFLRPTNVTAATFFRGKLGFSDCQEFMFSHYVKLSALLQAVKSLASVHGDKRFRSGLVHQGYPWFS
jgi:hypothetical protein